MKAKSKSQYKRFAAISGINPEPPENWDEIDFSIDEINIGELFMLNHPSNILGAKFKKGDRVLIDHPNAEKLKLDSTRIYTVLAVNQIDDSEFEYLLDTEFFILFWEEELEEINEEKTGD